MAYQLAINTYSQNTRYSLNNALATWANMNDGNCDTGTATGNPGTVTTDLLSSMTVNYVVIGYDKNTVIYNNNWGPNGSVGGSNVGTTNLQGSNDNSSWTTITSLPSYSAAGSPANGLATVTVNQTWRYLRINAPISPFALTEFQVWISDEFFAMF